MSIGDIYIIDKHGLYKTQKKIEAVLNTTEPQTVTEVRAFLCLVNYYHTFLPNNSTVVHPLHNPFKKQSKWNWNDECREAFNKAKQLYRGGQMYWRRKPEKRTDPSEVTDKIMT